MEKRDQDVKHKCAASDEEFYDCLGDDSSPVKADSGEKAPRLKEDPARRKASTGDGECHPQCTAGDNPDDVCGLSEKIKDVHVLDTRTDENMRGESQDDEHEPLSDAKKEEQEEEEKRRVEDALTDEEKEVRIAL